MFPLHHTPSLESLQKSWVRKLFGLQPLGENIKSLKAPSKSLAQGRSLSTLVWRSPSTLPGWVTIPPPWASRLLWEELFGWALLFLLKTHFAHWLFPVFLSRTRWVPWRHRLRPLFPFQCHVGNILFGGILTIKLLHMLCQHMLIWPQRRRLTLSFTYIGAEFPWQNALGQAHQYL